MEYILHNVFENVQKQLSSTSRFDMRKGQEILNAIQEQYREGFLQPKHITQEQFAQIMKKFEDAKFDKDTLAMFKSAVDEQLGRGEKEYILTPINWTVW